MTKTRHNKITWPAKLLSVLLAVFILNLCVSIPPGKIDQRLSGNTKEQVSKNKPSNKFLLQFAFEFLVEDNIEISSNASSTLLEELNEVKEDWCHQQFEHSKFLSFYIEKLHPPHPPSFFSFLVDARLFPPPEIQA